MIEMKHSLVRFSANCRTFKSNGAATSRRDDRAFLAEFKPEFGKVLRDKEFQRIFQRRQSPEQLAKHRSWARFRRSTKIAPKAELFAI